MANSVNKVILVGRIGKDPEGRVTANGKPVTTFSLATGDKYKQADGTYKEDTQWHRVQVWDKTAQFVNNYCKKGSRVYVEGVIKYREYMKGEVKQFITEITGNLVISLDPKQALNGAEPAEREYHAEQRANEPLDETDLPF